MNIAHEYVSRAHPAGYLGDSHVVGRFLARSIEEAEQQARAATTIDRVMVSHPADCGPCDAAAAAAGWTERRPGEGHWVAPRPR